MKRLLSVFALLIALTANVGAQDADAQYAQDLLKPGTVAPEFTIDFKYSTQNVPLSKFRGQYVVLDFWASWCPDCRKDMPRVKTLYEKFGRVGTQFIGISFDTNRDAWTKYIKENKLTWLQYSELKKWKKETKIDQDYHVNWIPTMYLIDPEGKVVLGTVMIEKMEAALDSLNKAHKLNKIDKMPEFEGGITAIYAFLSQNIKYPVIAMETGLGGRVTMEFTVEEDGTLSNISAQEVNLQEYDKKPFAKLTKEEQQKMREQVAKALAKEAFRVIRLMPKWKPGELDGKPAKVEYHIPVTFRMQ